MVRNYILLAISAVVVLTSCTGLNDDFGPKSEDIEQINVTGPRVLILNEGNFMFGNGSLSEFDAESGAVNNNVYESVNGEPLGDIPQSMVYTDTCLLIVVNNSNKVVGLDPSTYEKRWEISGINSPRYLASDGVGGWFVTSLYADKLYHFTADNGSLQELDYPGWAERIHPFHQGFLIENKESGRIDYFDPSALSFEEVLGSDSSWTDLKLMTSKLAIAVNGREVYAIYLHDGAISTTLIIEEDERITKISIDDNRLYYLSAQSLWSAFLQTDGHLMAPPDKHFELDFVPYNMEVRSGGEIYTTDAGSFVGRGYLMVHSEDGELLHQTQVGVIPQEILFVPKR